VTEQRWETTGKDPQVASWYYPRWRGLSQPAVLPLTEKITSSYSRTRYRVVALRNRQCPARKPEIRFASTAPYSWSVGHPPDSHATATLWGLTSIFGLYDGVGASVWKHNASSSTTIVVEHQLSIHLRQFDGILPGEPGLASFLYILTALHHVLLRQKGGVE